MGGAMEWGSERCGHWEGGMGTLWAGGLGEWLDGRKFLAFRG